MDVMTQHAQVLDPSKVKLHDAIAPLLDQVRKSFVPGVKLTLIVRSPGYDDRDVIISDDQLDEVNKVVQRKMIEATRR
jgi:hypothetical protein